MEPKTCQTCFHFDRYRNLLCRKNPPVFKPNDWSGSGTWPKVRPEDYCGSWKASENAPEEESKITSSVSCERCGLSWTAHDGASWLTVIEAKKTHECIPNEKEAAD